MLGGNNVQASAPEVRDVMEKGVAEAVTFPWGSIPLFGIDKVVKYHMDAPLYVTTFACRVQQGEATTDVGGAEEGDRRPLHQRMGRQGRRSVGRFRGTPAAQAEGRPGPRGLSDLARAARAWKKAAEPLQKTWADGVRKTGGDADAAMQELQAHLQKHDALAR